MSSHSVMRFAAFELHAATGELRHRGGVLKLAPQPFKSSNSSPAVEGRS